jgi:hypothetical protein
MTCADVSGCMRRPHGRSASPKRRRRLLVFQQRQRSLVWSMLLQLHSSTQWLVHSSLDACARDVHACARVALVAN